MLENQVRAQHADISARTEAMGFDERGGARDRTSLFSAAGLGWPDHGMAEDVHARKTDYPFSIDVSNNRLLAALDRDGWIRRAVTAAGVDDVRGRAIPGVYVHKRLAYWHGRLGIDVRVDDTGSSDVAATFLAGVIPRFTHRVRDVVVERTVFVPEDADMRPKCVVQVVTLTNRGEANRETRVGMRADPGAATKWPQLTVGTELLLPEGTVEGEAQLTLAAGQSLTLAAVVTFSDGNPDDPAHLGSLDGALVALDRTLAARAGALGRLVVAGDPWMGELATRAAELARQSVLLLPNGRSAGSFWGSNANPLPDVWTRDFAYGTLGLIESSPALAATAIDFLAEYGLPNGAWEREAQRHPDATGLEHSLGNACIGAVLAALLAQRHGQAALTASTTNLPDYLARLATALLAERPEPGELYRTLYISDGPSRGDFHTGSNILAWRAARAMSEHLANYLDQNLVAQLTDLAADLRDAIESRCVKRIGDREMFVEGIYGDGQFVRVHDGEESDLTLAAVYEFTERDDARIREHARWAHSTDNPYFSRTTGGVDFWDWNDYNGVTYPGHIHRLSAAGSRSELAAALHAIRQTTDLDGSFWWWPFGHGETDPARVKRGLGKCGWCAGEFVSVLLHDVVGVNRNHDARRLVFAPYTPWPSFRWEGLAFAEGTVDLVAEAQSVSVVNRTPETIEATLQVSLRPGDMIEDIRLNDENCRYQSEVVSVYDSAAVRTTTLVAPGETATLIVDVSTG